MSWARTLATSSASFRSAVTDAGQLDHPDSLKRPGRGAIRSRYPVHWPVFSQYGAFSLRLNSLPESSRGNCCSNTTTLGAL